MFVINVLSFQSVCKQPLNSQTSELLVYLLVTCSNDEHNQLLQFQNVLYQSFVVPQHEFQVEHN